MISIMSLTSGANAPGEFDLVVKPSRFYDVQIRINDRAIPLDVRARNSYSFSIDNNLNVEFNSMEICFRHKENAKGKPNLKSLAKVEVKRNRSGEEGLVSRRIYRKIAPAAHQFNPGQINCEKTYFSSLSKRDLERRRQQILKEEGALPNSFISIQ